MKWCAKHGTYPESNPAWCNYVRSVCTAANLADQAPPTFAALGMAHAPPRVAPFPASPDCIHVYVAALQAPGPTYCTIVFELTMVVAPACFVI